MLCTLDYSVQCTFAWEFSKIVFFFAFVHRLVVVDEKDRVIGIISLSDILAFLVLLPSGGEEEEVDCDSDDEATSSVPVQITIGGDPDEDSMDF